MAERREGFCCLRTVTASDGQRQVQGIDSESSKTIVGSEISCAGYSL